MGIFRPFVGGVKTVEQFQTIDHSNDQPFTPADVMTVARPLLALKAAQLLLNSEHGAFRVAAQMGFSDMEGKLARIIDILWPNSGWGTTEHGAAWDTYADTSAVLILGAAILKAPRVTRGAKIATAAVLGQEGVKAVWAIRRNAEYKAVSNQILKLPSSQAGKESMAEKLSAIGLAVATNDTDNPFMRVALTVASLYFAGVGAWRGEYARRSYNPIIDEMIAQNTDPPMSSRLIDCIQVSTDIL